MRKNFYKIAAVVAVLMALAMMMVFVASGTSNRKQALHVRPPMVAGSFYPADPDALRAMVDGFLLQSQPPEMSDEVIALIVPHAGYQYSGHVAARAFAQLNGRKYKRVVVIAPSHYETFPYISVFSGSAYTTPLGEIPVDKAFAEKLAAINPLIKIADSGHGKVDGEGEHALENELPFLQRTVGEFKLVPIVVGVQNYDIARTLGIALADVIGKEDSGSNKTLIVASSDLSHFRSYGQAVALDRGLLKAIEENDYFSLSLNAERRIWEACGYGPIVAAMIAAERLGTNKNIVLAYANSGDVTGDTSSVVGYGAAALLKRNGPFAGEELPAITLSQDEKEKLLALAKESVEAAVRGKNPPLLSALFSPALQMPRGAFVTLKKQGELRGCVGNITPDKPLVDTVREMARQSATKDKRFRPVTEEELDKLDYEISILSPLHHVADIRNIVVGRDGLLIRKGKYQGLLLPQVPVEQGWNLKTFLDQTAIKAGLPPSSWQDPDADLFSFSALVFSGK